MGILSIYHPDIYDFIEAKSYDEGRLVHFNLTVMVDDDFMNAVKNDKTIYLHYPVYDDKGQLIKNEKDWKYKKEVRARELWDLIMQKAYDNGEPGIMFYDNINHDNNINYIEKIVSSNPCNEFISGIVNKEKLKNYVTVDENSDYWGACNLGSIFLHNHIINPFTTKAKFDFLSLRETIKVAVKTLDTIIDINKYPLRQYENYQKTFRPIGLGVTGLADALVMLNMRYGSKESLEFIDNLFDFIAVNVYLESTLLAKELGAFPALDRELFLQSNFIQKHIKNSKNYKDIWEQVQNNIRKYGIRNSRMLSIAPTGTLSLTFGDNCSSGIEPIFSLTYKRKVKIGGQDDSNIQVIDMDDYAYRLYNELKEQNVPNLIENPPFVTAMELSVKDHLVALKEIAYHTDMNISKTINVPTDYSFEDAKNVYMYAWENGIKSCTIFRPNPIRAGILLTENNDNNNTETETTDLKRGDWEPLPDDITYFKRKIYIGCGKLNLFIGYSPSKEKICDMYVVRTGQGGCEKNLQGMVIAMSGMLRLGGSLYNIEKAFAGMGACNSFVAARTKGQKLNQGASCGNAILNEIKKFMAEIKNEQEIPTLRIEKEEKQTSSNLFTAEEREFLNKYGEISFSYKYKKCPVCGTELAIQEGCMTCQECGWTKCS